MCVIEQSLCSVGPTVNKVNRAALCAARTSYRVNREQK